MWIRQWVWLAALFAAVNSAILGIDLGQDFTKAVLVAPGVPFEIVMSADSKRKDVSGIGFKPLGDDQIERIYGSATSSYCTRFPKNCALNYKSLLGKSIEDFSVTEYLKAHSGVELVETKNQRSTIAFEIDNHKYPVEELLAMNIQNIAARASEIMKEKSPGGYSKINDVAFTIPSYFDLAQRNAIKDAAELAGFNVVALIDDGLAIAVNYATKTEFPIGKQYHIIYDMGAGSTTATLVSFEKIDEISPLNITIEGYSYDESLGGQLFTNAIAEIIEERFLETHPKISTSSFKSNARSIVKIFQTAEKAKLILSANNEAPISIESIVDDIDFRTKITRDEFEEFLSEYASKITEPILKLLEQSDITLDDIKSVIYSGGSQRVPFVQQHLLSLIGSESVSKTVNADEAAVFGATLRAVQISKMFKAKEYNITSNSLYDYTIRISENEEINVFPKGIDYFSTTEIDLTDAIINNDGLSAVLTENYQGYATYETANLQEIKSKFIFNETDCIDDVKYIGKFTLSESRLFQFDYLEARCEVKVSDSEAEAKETKAGFLDKILSSKDDTVKTKVKKANVPFKTTYISSRPLGSASKQDLRAHLQSLNLKDNQRKQISEALNELESTLYSARSYLEDDEIIEKGPAKLVEEASSTVSEYLEWLDYESDGAKLKEIKGKVQTIKDLISQISEYMDSLSVSLEKDDFKELHQQGLLAINSIQGKLMDITEESLEYSKNFTMLGLDFDKEVTKLTKFARSISLEKVETICKEMIAFYEQVKDLIDSTEEDFQSRSREDLFKLKKKAIAELTKVINLESDLKAVNEQRVKELNAVVTRFFRQQRRAAAKAAAKAQEEAAKEEIEEDVENPDQVDDEIFQDAVEEPAIEDEEYEEESQSTLEHAHDEL